MARPPARVGWHRHLRELYSRLPGISAETVEWLKTWHLSMVAHWLQMDMLHANEGVPVLIGPQGCGKTIFCRRLLPKHLQEYVLEHNFAILGQCFAILGQCFAILGHIYYIKDISLQAKIC